MYEPVTTVTSIVTIITITNLPGDLRECSDQELLEMIERDGQEPYSIHEQVLSKELYDG